MKDSIQDTIIVKEIDSQLDKRAINYYANAADGLKVFDESFAENLEDTTDYLTWLQKMEKNPLVYALLEPKTTTPSGKALREWYHSKPVRKDYDSDEEFPAAEYEWKAKTPTEKSAGEAIYMAALADMQEFFNEKAEKLGYAEDSDEALEMLGSALYILNPDGKFNDFYTKNNEAIPETYDVTSFVTHYQNKTLDEYVASTERKEYREDRAETNASIFLAGNMTDKDNVTRLLDALASYGVTEEKYESFGYTYDSLKHRASTAVITYRNRLDYELGRLNRSDYDSDKAEDFRKYADEQYDGMHPQGFALFADGERYAGEPVLLTEFGGRALQADAKGEAWGYSGAAANEEAFLKQLQSIMKGVYACNFQGYCYTQLTDVQQEVNGLLYADRTPKVDVERLKELFVGKN